MPSRRSFIHHLAAGAGALTLGRGLDALQQWITTSCDHILTAQGLTDADKVAILGGNLVRLLGIPA